MPTELHDYFAALAMQAFIAHNKTEFKDVAVNAYQMADEMMIMHNEKYKKDFLDPLNKIKVRK